MILREKKKVFLKIPLNCDTLPPFPLSRDARTTPEDPHCTALLHREMATASPVHLVCKGSGHILGTTLTLTHLPTSFLTCTVEFCQPKTEQVSPHNLGEYSATM